MESRLTTLFLCYFRILTLMRDCNASFEDEYKAKHNAKSSHAMLDRGITMGKVEHYVKVNLTASLLYLSF